MAMSVRACVRVCVCLSHFFVWENLTSVSERYIFTNIFGFFLTWSLNEIFSYFHTSVSEQHIFTNDQ